jgi:hypothetical protein
MTPCCVLIYIAYYTFWVRHYCRLGSEALQVRDHRRQTVHEVHDTGMCMIVLEPHTCALLIRSDETFVSLEM